MATENLVEIPVLVNGLTSMDVRTKNNYHETKSSSHQNRGHKIIIIGDSLARGAASNVKHNVDDNCRSSGFVRPAANIDRLISSITEDIKNLMSNDIMLFWGALMM